jgi:hypothetical protein
MKLMVFLVLFLSISLVFCEEPKITSATFEGNYNLLPKSKAIYKFMIITPTQVILFNTKEDEAIVKWKEVIDFGFITIGDYGYRYEFKKDLLILTPSSEGANIIYARRF